ncbi:phage head-tail connector protein [Pseudobacillus sp. 179-B 2D1 NHS]|uniref:phage head-tail connector protein n=1 Tax=Pseudobacillus sp. 179-B 2D1 NHS TaxID=3374292 RepID=UPI0038797BF9
MIPLLIEWLKVYCNNPFTNPSGKEILPGGVRIFIAKACEYNMNKAGITSRSMGSVSYSYNLDFPESMIRYIRPYKRVKFHATR